VLDQLSALFKHTYVSPLWMAKIYAGLGDKDKSVECLEKAYEDRSIVSVEFIKTNPMFDPLRSDPRFVDLLRRTYLQPCTRNYSWRLQNPADKSSANSASICSRLTGAGMSV
jgi:hypothetical protein